MYYGIDPSYILVIIGSLLCMAASSFVRSTYSKYSRVYSRSNLTGEQAARRILQMSGINDVTIHHVSGELTDYYDPRNKKLCLSDSTYASSSVAAVGVAAHECGHAIQHHTGYLPIKLRAMVLPLANLGSKIGLPLVLIGLFFGLRIPTANGNISLAMIGVWVFSFAVAFQLITLPVEFNASSRAARILSDYGILTPDEVSNVRSVLGAAAMTYVAAAASSVLQLLRLLSIANRRKD